MELHGCATYKARGISMDTDYDRISLLLQDTATLLSEARQCLEYFEAEQPGHLQVVAGNLLVAIERHEERLAMEGY